MKKVLFIVPHLSTGGMPQYTYNLMSKIINDVDVYCIEYTLLAWNYVVQRNRIKNLLGDKFYAEFDDKKEIINQINQINPDIIHFQELPEYFMDDGITSEIYKKNRSYVIIETSHDSSFNTDSKRFYPDQFALISNYQKQNFLKLGIPISIVESDIEYKVRQDREEGLKKLGLDPSLKHVLNVGLFTSRKNQKEIFEYANALIDEPIQFHFVGNLADNFKDYWGPLVVNAPPNIKIWGERGDVDDFYSCMDLFLFTSRGNDNDKETSPLVIREAIGYKIPLLIYKLPVYMCMYDKYETINYLHANNFSHNINEILYLLGLSEKVNLIENNNQKNVAVSISTYTNNNYIVEKTIKCINSIKKFTDYSIICTDHKPAPTNLIEMCDHYFYDSNNILTNHTFYDKAWLTKSDFKFNLNLKSSKNNGYHGPAVHQNIYAGVLLADMLKYDYVICMNFDLIINEYDSNIIKECIQKMEKQNKNAFFLMTNETEGTVLKTVFFITRPKFYLDIFQNIKNAKDYEDLIPKYNSESNGLENLYFHILKNDLDTVIIENKSELDFFNSSNDFNIDKSFTSSQTEYSAILPIKNPKNKNNVVFLYKSSNDIEVDYKWEIYSHKNDLIYEHTVPKYNNKLKNNSEVDVFVDVEEFLIEDTKKYNILLKNISNNTTVKIFKNITIDDIKCQGEFEWIL